MRHKGETRKMLSESLDKGWKAWSMQATELQLLRASHENRKRQGLGFIKMDESSINMVWEELANDIYELTANHMEEINQMVDEFEDQQIMTTMQLDAYETEHCRQDSELDEEETSWKQSDLAIPVQKSQQEEVGSVQQPPSKRQEQQEEPNLFDIMEEEVSDKGEEDLTKEEHVDLMGEDGLE